MTDFEDIKRRIYHEKVEEINGVRINGYDFEKGINFKEIMRSFKTTGFQASCFFNAIEIVNKMIKEDAVIYLGYTSNMISSGLREIFKYLVKNKKINYIVTTGGGIEEDLIKCFGDFILGNFSEFKGEELYNKGINRIGNIYVPDDRYVKFEEFFIPVLEKIYNSKKSICPSDLIWRLGESINDERSVCYWAWKNKIKIFCPTITDGAIGDMVYIFKHKHDGFVIDIVEEFKRLNDSTISLDKSGVIILGSGVVKHSILNANMFRNGTDYAVYINTAQEFDGSDAGASPDEAITWGKIKKEGEMVKVFGDATILFPLLVAETFASNEK